jgi:hypothetical protein
MPGVLPGTEGVAPGQPRREAASVS